MAKNKAEQLRTALAEHRKAQEEYDRAEAALSLAATHLGLTRYAVELATNNIKDEGVD